MSVQTGTLEFQIPTVDSVEENVGFTSSIFLYQRNVPHSGLRLLNFTLINHPFRVDTEAPNVEDKKKEGIGL